MLKILSLSMAIAQALFIPNANAQNPVETIKDYNAIELECRGKADRVNLWFTGILDLSTRHFSMQEIDIGLSVYVWKSEIVNKRVLAENYQGQYVAVQGELKQQKESGHYALSIPACYRYQYGGGYYGYGPQIYENCYNYVGSGEKQTNTFSSEISLVTGLYRGKVSVECKLSLAKIKSNSSHKIEKIDSLESHTWTRIN